MMRAGEYVAKGARAARRVWLTARWHCLPRQQWIRMADRRRWVFVMGCNRSGKTTLANLLGNHAGVAVIPNANELTRALPSSGTEDCAHIWTEKLDRFRLSETSDRGPAARLAFDWMNHRPSPRDTMVIESDLPAVQMRWLQEVFRDSYFIGVVRNGYSVAEGLRLKEGYELDRCARQWSMANKVMLEDAELVRRFLLVRYEEFVEQPERVIESVAQFAGFDAGQLTPLIRTGWRFGNADMHYSRLKNANPELMSRLSAKDLDLVTEAAGEMLEQLGYLVRADVGVGHARA